MPFAAPLTSAARPVRLPPMRASGGRRRLGRFAVACAVSSLAVSGTAVAGWDPPEPIAPGTNVFRVELAPGGPGYVVGFPLTSPDRFRYAPRPIGGTLGALPIEFPTPLGTNYDGFWRFDAAGNAVVANTYDDQIGHIPLGGFGGSAQDLPAGYSPDAVSVAPTGEALIAAVPSFGTFRVALRAAGPSAVADFSQGGSQSFGTPNVSLTVIGLLLQADGGAVVVWQEGDDLYQSVRPSGELSFAAPTVIPDPRADKRKFSVRLRGDASGHAMLAWQGSSGGAARDHAVASVRAPGGTFGPAQIVGTGRSVVNVTPSVTSSGDGLAVWSHAYPGEGCQPGTVMGAALHAGTFAAQQPLGPNAFPLTSSQGFPDTVLAAGDRVAVPILEVEDAGGTPCTNFSDDRRGLFVRHFRSGPSGLVDEGISELSPIQAKPSGTTSFPQINALALEPGGRMLVSYQVDTARYLRSFDGVAPGASGPPPPAPAPPGAGGAPATPAKAILPLKPVDYFKVLPIDPKAASYSLTCTPDVGLDGEACRAKMLAYFLTKGRFAAGKSAAKAKPRTKAVLIASGAATVPSGKRQKIKLRFTKAGRTLIARGKAVKIVLDLTIARGSQTATQRFTTTLKAQRRAKRR